MWLEKIIFIGSTMPLGKHLLEAVYQLLGAVYQLLHQVAARLATNQSPSNIGAP
jgi:hypothetical protein